jgi:predicted metal-dependent hydrolase
MNKEIILSGKKVEYTLKAIKRSKRLRIVVKSGGDVIVSKPRLVPQYILNKFLIQKFEWLIAMVEKMKKFPRKKTSKETKADFEKYKEIALKIAETKAKHFSKIYNLKYNNIYIKNQSTRWGSCSKRGNLNFNYKIALLNDELANYLVVHEICHLGEFNHSKKFWDLVAKTIPNYLVLRKQLKGVE